MVFKKKTKEDIEEVPIVESPNAEEIEIEEEDVVEDNMESVPEQDEPVELPEESNNSLQVVLGQLQNRITSIEATLYRLLNR